MRKIFLITILFLFFINLTAAEDVICCYNSILNTFSWFCNNCPSTWSVAVPIPDGGWCTEPAPSVSSCSASSPQPSSQSSSQSSTSGTPGGIKPGSVSVTWTPVTISICPPGILGLPACNYPNLIDLIQRFNELLRTIAPPTLVILIIIGGLMYLLTPFGVEKYIQSGHRYIRYAILGFIILLLVTLIFSIISAILGGPGP